MRRTVLLLCLAGIALVAGVFPVTSQQVVRRPIVTAAPCDPNNFGPDPSTITDLQLWLKADAICQANGTEITTWSDSSGNGRDATGVAVNTLKPTYRTTDGPNSQPAVRMVSYATGQGGYFTLPDFLTALAATSGQYFVVVKIDNDPPEALAQAAPPLGDWGSSIDEYFVFPSDSGIYDGWGSSTRKTTGDPTPALTSWRLYEVRSASGAWENRIDGITHFGPVANTVAWSAAPKIGRSTSSNKFMHGLISEIIFYNKVLSAGEYTTLKAYINTKYGLTLARVLPFRSPFRPMPAWDTSVQAA